MELAIWDRLGGGDREGFNFDFIIYKKYKYKKERISCSMMVEADRTSP
jgi:hypothetical protein